MKFLTDILAKASLVVDGAVTLNSVANSSVDTDRFLVIESNVVKYRTGTQLLSDIGAAAAAAGLPPGGTAGQILAKIDATNYNTEWIDNYTSNVRHLVKLASTMTVGTPVYVSGSTGQSGTNMIVSPASNTSEATSSKTLGLLMTGGATNDIVFVVTEGLLAGLNTSSAAAGDPVWLGPNGTLLYGLANKPVAPIHMVFIGVVTRVQQNNGEIFVKVQNGYELEELHNVLITDVADKHFLYRDGPNNLWKNASISTILGYTPASSTSVSGTINRVAKFTSASAVGDSQIFDNGTSVGVNITSPLAKFHVDGSIRTSKFEDQVFTYAGAVQLTYTTGLGFNSDLVTRDGTSATFIFANNVATQVKHTGVGSNYVANYAVGATAEVGGTTTNALIYGAGGYFVSRRRYSDDISTNGSNGMYGVVARVIIDPPAPSSMRSGAVYALDAGLTLNSGNATVASGVDISANFGTSNSSTPGVVTDYYGIRIRGTIGSATGGTAIVTNYYGLYLANPTINATGNTATRWAIYSLDTASSYIEGSLLIGTTTNANYKVDVNGTLRTVGNTYLATTSGSGVTIGNTTAPGALLELNNPDSQQIEFRLRNSLGAGMTFNAFGGDSVTMDPSVSNGKFYFGRDAALSIFAVQSGNVGIGTATPSAKLNVEVSTAAASTPAASMTFSNSLDGGHRILFKSSTGNLVAIDGDVTSTGGGTNDGVLKFWTSVDGTLSQRMSIASAGAVTINNLAGTGTRVVVANASGELSTGAVSSSIITGSGTTNYVSKWTPDGVTLGDSQIFDNGTNVGINNTTPESKLHVGNLSGNATTPTAIQLDNTYRSAGDAFDKLKLYLYKSATETYGLGLGGLADLQYWAGSSSTGAHRFFTSQTERLRITSGGNVGIGDASPTDLLVVNGRMRVNGTNRITFGNNSGGYAGIGVTGATTGNLTFNTFDGTSDGERLRIFANGRVFVGASPTDAGYQLDVNGSIRASGLIRSQATVGNTNGYFQLDHPGAQTWKLGVFTDNTSTFSIGNDNGGTFASRYLNITNSGNVGIGTSSPVASAKLDVTSTTQGFLPPRMTAAQRAAISSPAIGLVVYQTDGNEGLWIYTNGNGWKALAIVL